MSVVGIFFFLSGTWRIVLPSKCISDSVNCDVGFHRIVSSGALVSVYINIHLILCMWDPISAEILSFCSSLCLGHLVSHAWRPVVPNDYLNHFVLGWFRPHLFQGQSEWLHSACFCRKLKEPLQSQDKTIRPCWGYEKNLETKTQPILNFVHKVVSRCFSFCAYPFLLSAHRDPKRNCWIWLNRIMWTASRSSTSHWRTPGPRTRKWRL